MISKIQFLDGVKQLFSYGDPISISGESGTGKTTLALYLVGNCLKDGERCIWIQASELFPVKRLETLFEKQSDTLDYLRENIFVIPKDQVVHTYQEQCTLLQNIVSPSSILPPDLRFIVIDNISHHLRYRITHYNKISDVSQLLDKFYEDQLMQLMLFCRRANIDLILIHEVTYDPKTSQLRPFFYKLYDRIKTVDLILSNRFNRTEKQLTISVPEFTKKFTYTLEQRGIVIS
jgi:RecA/RadA recombinase